MYRVEQVLVPVDFSGFSRCALAFARSLGETSPQIQLAHVIDAWAASTRQVLFPYAAMGEDEIEFEHELLEEARAHLHRYFKIDKSLEKSFISEPIVRMGPVNELLPELARTVDSEMVVMGAFGEGGVHPDALGATAERMLRSVVQPLVLVRDFERKPSIKHIVVAVDLGPKSGDVLERALGLALQTGATMETIYVVPSPFVHDTHNILSQALKFNARQVLSRASDKIDALFERMHQSLEVPHPVRPQAAKLLKSRRTLFGDPSAEIIRHAYENEADLVVVGAHNPQTKTTRTLGRVAWTVARGCPTNVMVVPPTRARTPLGEEQE
ncbi:MAG: universal stress protein [Bradymonadaceae bacterium]